MMRPDQRVGQAEVAVGEEERDREGDRRRHAGRQDPQRDAARGLEAAARQGIGGRHADQQRQHVEETLVISAVDEGAREMPGPERPVVRECRREQQLVAEDVVVRPERHLHQPERTETARATSSSDACRCRRASGGCAETSGAMPAADRGRAAIGQGSICLCIRRPGQPVDHPAQHEDAGHHQRRDGAAIAPLARN